MDIHLPHVRIFADLKSIGSIMPGLGGCKRLSNRRQPRSGLNSHHKYNESTGQVYSERIYAIQSSDDRYWAYDGRLAVRKRERGFLGSRSLQDAAIECILQNITDITLEAIERLPIHVVQRIWDEAKKRLVRSSA